MERSGAERSGAEWRGGDGWGGIPPALEPCLLILKLGPGRYGFFDGRKAHTRLFSLTRPPLGTHRGRALG